MLLTFVWEGFFFFLCVVHGLSVFLTRKLKSNDKVTNPKTHNGEGRDSENKIILDFSLKKKKGIYVKTLLVHWDTAKNNESLVSLHLVVSGFTKPSVFKRMYYLPDNEMDLVSQRFQVSRRPYRETGG